jgi:hypothetical protein
MAMPSSNPLLMAVTHLIQNAPKPIKWLPSTMTPAMEKILADECLKEDPFDQIQSKRRLHERMTTHKQSPLVLKQPNATLVALLDCPSQADDIPWTLWSQIVQLFKRSDNRSYTIFFCADPALRTFPKPGEVARPLHINGGYTYPCDPNCVFLFRAEDATRVLIHELMHSACCDNTALHLEQREAETEAWAELLWTAFMSQGNLKKLEPLVRQQDVWSRSQNTRLIRDKNFASGPMGFPWRYTIGKTEMWNKWGIMGHSKVVPINTLRLTMPPTKAMKSHFGVSQHSTIL